MRRTAIFQFSILAVLSLVFMISVLLHLLEFREQQRQAEAFDTSGLYQWVNETHTDYLHLLNGLQRLRDGDPTISEYEVRHRFENLWKRAEAFQQRGSNGDTAPPPAIRRIAADLLATMASVEPTIYGMTAGDALGFRRVWPKMSSLLGPLEALSTAARRQEALQARRTRESNRRSYWALSASLAGLILSAVCVVFILILERQRARRLAKSAQEAREEADWIRVKLEETIEAVPEGIALFDANDRLLLANRRYVDLYRRSRRPLRSSVTHRDLLEGASVAGFGPATDEALAERRAYHEAPDGSLEMKTGDGRWLLITERKTGASETIGVEVDISRIKEREALLHGLVEENARFATAIDAASSAIAIIDATGDVRPIIFANPAFLSMTGFPTERCIGHGFDLVFAENTDPAAVSLLERCIADGTDGQTELLLKRADGSSYWADLTISPITDPSGLTRHFVTIHTDVTIRKVAERELVSAKEAAEEANRSKSEFLAVLSHEVRTPLNSVLGTLQILSEREPREDAKRLINGAHEAGRGLVAILNDILDSAKLESGKLELEATRFDLPGLLEGISSLLESRCEGKGLGFEAAIASELPRNVIGDPTRLRQVLLNLSDNAVKFTEIGKIALAARPVEGGDAPLVRVEVADTGVGMTQEAMSKLFGQYVQADASVARRFGGTGLGLSICRQLTELMGGRIGVDSRLGEGSNFWIEVPLEAAAEIPAAGTAEPTAEMRKLNILMADDDPVNALVVGTMLKRSGHSFEVVENGEDAIEAVLSGAFDLVLMDVSMPGTDGVEATRRIREFDGTESAVPILALTGYTSPADLDRFLAAGMDGCLTKPIDRQALSTAIASWAAGGGSDYREMTGP